MKPWRLANQLGQTNPCRVVKPKRLVNHRRSSGSRKEETLSMHHKNNKWNRSSPFLRRKLKLNLSHDKDHKQRLRRKSKKVPNNHLEEKVDRS